MSLRRIISQITHLICVVCHRYVERLCEDGLLKEGEASEFLEEIQEGLLELNACPEATHEVASVAVADK